MPRSSEGWQGPPLTYLAGPELAGAVPVEGTYCASSPESGLSTQTGFLQPLGVVREAQGLSLAAGP